MFEACFQLTPTINAGLQAEREAGRVKIKKENAEENLRQLATIQIKREHADEDEGVSVVAPPAKKPRCEPEIIELSD